MSVLVRRFLLLCACCWGMVRWRVGMSRCLNRYLSQCLSQNLNLNRCRYRFHYRCLQRSYRLNHRVEELECCRRVWRRSSYR